MPPLSRFRNATVLLALPLLAGCGSGRNASTPGDSGEDVDLHVLRPKDLPAPFATPSVSNPPTVVGRPAGAALTLPAGFRAAEWANGLENPRVLAVAPNGDVFVAESGAGRVRVLRDADGDGSPEARSLFAAGLRQPFGIAFYPPGADPTHVYVGNADAIVRFPYRNGDRTATGAPQIVVPGLPADGHWTRNLAFRPDGAKMYVSVGSRENVAEEEEKRAAILEYNPDGSGYRVFASGLRNPVGLAFHPITGALWASVNERDGLGDDLVPDYVTSVRDGGFYGWPWYYIGGSHDPRMPERPDLKNTAIVPDVLIGAHSAPLGIAFYTGSAFPAAYRNHAFVALHGSWNRAERTGYKVVRIPFAPDGAPAPGYADFVTGWKTADGAVWGRPVAVAVAGDGALLISDDGANAIWRVTYAASGQMP